MPLVDVESDRGVICVFAINLSPVDPQAWIINSRVFYSVYHSSLTKKPPPAQ